MRFLVLAALGTLASSAARADPARTACLKFSDIGCFYASDSSPAGLPLLVYHRGYNRVYCSEDREAKKLCDPGSVPREQCLASAQQAFAEYQLGQFADAAKMAVLVICSSDIGIMPQAVENLSKAANRVFTKNILAAHSGGYVGLHKTLNAGMPADRVLLLDMFYESDDSIARLVQSRVSGGATCTGYYTAHNKARYETWYEPNFQCAVDDMGDDSNHSSTVVRCLSAYLNRRSCLTP